MLDLVTTLREENRNMGIRVISELCNNSHQRRVRGCGRKGCWRRATKETRVVKGGSSGTRIRRVGFEAVFN